MLSLFLLYVHRILNGIRSLISDVLIVNELTQDNVKTTVPLNLSVTIRKRIVAENVMSEDIVGVVKIFAGVTPPSGWRLCDGSVLSITDFPDLFSAIGTIYGGDGISTFALPDLRGRVPVGAGAGPGLSHRSMGQVYGSETVVIDINNLPLLISDSVVPMGQSTNHSVTSNPPKGEVDNMQPSITLNYIICCEGRRT